MLVSRAKRHRQKTKAKIQRHNCRNGIEFTICPLDDARRTGKANGEVQCQTVSYLDQRLMAMQVTIRTEVNSMDHLLQVMTSLVI
jgi:hypothetical protein